MPIFKATLSDGRVVTVEADNQPSEQDILTAVEGFQQAPPTKSGSTVEELGQATDQPLIDAAKPIFKQPEPKMESTIKGGEPVRLSGAAESLSGLGEKLGEESTRSALDVVPDLQVKPDDTVAMAVGKEAYNLALGLPKFMTTPIGLSAGAAAEVAPILTGAAFTSDMLHSVGRQILDTHKNWQAMTPAQKAQAVTAIVGTGGMAALVGAATAKGIKTRLASPIAEAGAPQTAKALEQVITGEALKTPEGATVEKPGVTEILPPTEEPASVAEVKPTQPTEIVPATTKAISELGQARSEWAAKEMESKTKEKLAQMAGKELGRQLDESRGQEILDYMEENGISPKQTAENFWSKTYANLPKDVQNRFNRMIEKVTGFKIGDAVAVLPDGTKETAQAHSQMYSPSDAPESVKTLEGTERGLIALMETANQNFIKEQPTEVSNASQIPSATSVSQPEIRPSVGKETPLRQQGETAAPQEAIPAPTEAVKAGGEVPKFKMTFQQFLDAPREGELLDALRKLPRSEKTPEQLAADAKLQSASDAVDKAGLGWIYDRASQGKKIQIEANVRRLPKTKQKIIKAYDDALNESVKISNSGNAGQRRLYDKAVAAGIIENPEATQPSTVAMSEQKYRVGTSPQLHTLVERLPATEIEKANGEQPVKVRNEKTGEVSTVLENQLKPVTERTAEQKATKSSVDDKLKKLGYSDAQISAMPKAGKKALAERGQKIVGMGGAVPGEFIGKSQSELPILEQTIKQLAESNQIKPAVKDSFDIGRETASLKDGVNDFIDGLKAAGKYLKLRLEGKPVWTDFKDALGERHLSLTESVANSKRWVRSALKAVPSVKLQEAISDYVDTGGNKELLKQAAAETRGRYKAGYEQAQNLSPEEIKMAEGVRSYFDERLNQAIEEGILEDGVENYIHRIYEKDSAWKNGILSELRSGIFTGKPSLAKQRVFQYDFEAEKNGMRPIKSFIKRVAAYDLALNKAIADREIVKAMSQITMPDGRPMVDVGGIGTPVPKGEVTEATLIRPSFKPEDLENPTNNRKDYKAKDYPALRRWKWVTKDSEGNPIFVQGDVLVHPDAIAQVKPLFEPSAIRKTAIGRAALGVSSAIKQTMLDLSGFHLAQITVHGWEHRSFKPVGEINFADNNVRGLIKGGLQVGDTRGYDLFSEGLTGSSLTKYIPKFGQKLHDYNQWLFESYIPRLKVATGLHALERNRERFPKLSEEELYHLTANQMNAAFGELNYEMIGRSKTTQDVMRLALLAPDFLEARGRFVAQAGTKYGREQFTALALGAATLYMTARIINKLLSGEYHFEPKNAFSILYNNKAYSLRTVQGDLLHLATEPSKFAFHRLNPVYGRTALEFLTERDAFGRKRDIAQQAKDFASTIVPISLRGALHPSEQSLWESFINAFGVTERRSTAIDTIQGLAQEFRKSHKIRNEPGEFIYDAEKDAFRPIRQAALFGSPEKVSSAISDAVKEGTLTAQQIKDHFKNYTTRPFTGSKTNEKSFLSSLSEDNRRIYEDAKDERRKVWEKFLAGYNLYHQSP